MPIDADILIAESRAEIAKYLQVALSCHGYRVSMVRDGVEVAACLKQPGGQVSLVMLDAQMPRKDGLETLREIGRLHPSVPVILFSAEPTPAVLREATKQGATDFLKLPISHSDLITAVAKVLAKGNWKGFKAVSEGRPEIQDDRFLYLNPRMEAIRAALKRVALSDVPVIFYGESGVGKEVLARTLHLESRRASKPFLKLNCAAVPSELLESELFGYDRGAFTGAYKSTPGKFELADGGSILLDEIGDMDPKLQAKLLHVLQDKEFIRLGGREAVRVNVRVLSATHRNLKRAIAEGQFRKDLYYRINVIRIDIPPLRERKEEIIPMAEFFLNKHSTPAANFLEIPEQLRQSLLAYHWPGNIRELENLMQRLLVLRDPDAIIAELQAPVAPIGQASPANPDPQSPARFVPEAVPKPPTFETVRRAEVEIEVKAILHALDATRWNRKKAAQSLGMEYKALLYKMKKLGIASESGPGAAAEEREKKRTAGGAS